MNQEKIVVIDFGGQYNQLVARRVRECNVYCEIYSYKTDLEQIRAMVDRGEYFTINRARQFGKTTTLRALGHFLKDKYRVVNLDFQMIYYILW